MFIAGLFIIAQTGRTHMSFSERELSKLWYIHTVLLIGRKILVHATTWVNLKGITLWWMRKSNCQRVHIAEIHSYNVLKWYSSEMGNIGCQGIMREWGQERSVCDYKRVMIMIFVMIEMLYLLTMSYKNNNILAVILYYTFIKCYHQRNWIKGTKHISIFSLQLHTNLQWSQNKKLN